MGFGQRFSQADIDKLRAKQLAQQPAVNKKVMGAVKSSVGGVDFASKIELYAYNLFKALGLEFEFQKVIVLQEKFRYNGEAIREVKSIVDFYFPVQNVICDTKGFQTDRSALKFKMLKHRLHKSPELLGTPEIVLPRTKDEVEALANRLAKQKQV